MSPNATRLDRRQRRIGAALLAGVLILFVVLGGRLIHINTTLRPDLALLAKSQQRGASTVPARRGMILDARGRVVALSQLTPDVFVDPALIDDRDAVVAELSARVNLSPQVISEKILARPDSRFVVVAQRVDEVTAQAVRDMHHPAVGLHDRPLRTYPLGSSMAHVLGWVGREGGGLEGVELFWDEHLRGKDGRRTTVRDVRRRSMRPLDAATVAPTDGGHLVLTLDAEVQRITEEALEAGVALVKAQSGIAVVLSPSTGDVLAMACCPTFDPGSPVTPESLPLRRNRALTDPVEPGSTFKPIIACGAMEGGFVTSTEKIDCHSGVHYFGSRRVTDTTPHGLLHLRDIIRRSSNIGMGVIGTRMGNDALHATLLNFGFGRRTGIGGLTEATGVVYPLRRWTSFSATSIPIGYEVLVTPIQLAQAFATIVNDGVMVQPRLVKQLLDSRGRQTQSFDSPQIVRRVVSSDVARYVSREAMVAVVEEGGGRTAKVGPYSVMGKTGTAKLISETGGGYEEHAYLGSFVGAAPVEDPQVVVLVMIRRPDPSIAYYGAQVAGPVVGRIIVDTLTYLEVPPDDPARLAGM